MRRPWVGRSTSPSGPATWPRRARFRRSRTSAAEMSLETLATWRRLGVPEVEAVQWWALDVFTAEDGVGWWRAGYSPLQAEYVDILARYSVLRSGTQDPAASPQQWRTSGLPPHLVCLFLAAGICDVDEARKHHDAALARPELYRHLTERALAAGMDPWRLSVVPAQPSPGIGARLTIGRILWRLREAVGTVACSRGRQARSSPTRSPASRSGHPPASRRARHVAGPAERQHRPLAVHHQQLRARTAPSLAGGA